MKKSWSMCGTEQLEARQLASERVIADHFLRKMSVYIVHNTFHCKYLHKRL